MGSCCGSLERNETGVVQRWTDREVMHGPQSLYCVAPCLASVSVVPMVELKEVEYVVVTDALDPSRNRVEHGPQLLRLSNGFETFSAIQRAVVLDRDDYVIVTALNGDKRSVRGAAVFRPAYGDVWTEVRQALTVPMHKYLRVKDSSIDEPGVDPERNVVGPTVFFPGPFDEILPQRDGSILRSAIQVSDECAFYLRLHDGSTVLVSKPQFLIPQVGEVVLGEARKVTLAEDEFAILEEIDGGSKLMLGADPDTRSFFLPPFAKLHEFPPLPPATRPSIKFSTLPQVIPTELAVRTSDNVEVNSDLRIAFRVSDPVIYCGSPLSFVDHLIFFTSDALLDAVAKLDLSEFMRAYPEVTEAVTERARAKFEASYGICVEDVQVVSFACVRAEAQRQIDSEVSKSIALQGKLREADLEVLAMEKEREVSMRKKDLELEIAEKDNEIARRKQALSVELSLQEAELKTEEERKRNALLQEREANAVIEGGFEGRAQGASFRAFVEECPAEMSLDHKLAAWRILRGLDADAMLYSKVQRIDVVPPGVDAKRFEVGLDAQAKRFAETAELFLPAILGYDAGATPLKAAGGGGKRKERGGGEEEEEEDGDEEAKCKE